MMNDTTPSRNTSIEIQVLGFLLNNEFYNRVKNIVTRDMFEGRYVTLFDTISYSHKKYNTNLSRDQLDSLFMDRNPAMPQSAKQEVFDIIANLSEHMSDAGELESDVVKNFWVRDKARQIGEKAISIFTGESEHFGELKTLIDMVEDGRMSDKTTYSEMDKDFLQLLEEETGEPDFPFDWDLMHNHLAGMDRGNLGIIFARPEVGKTTFCSFLASSYIKQKQKVVYWANEEPAEKIKMRIIQSFFELTRDEMREQAASLADRYKQDIEPYLTVMDSVGTSMAELNDYAQLNEPDNMFYDHLDKFRVD